MDDLYQLQINSEIKKYFGGDLYRFFIFVRTYSRWSDILGRRETWGECIQRYIDFMKENLGDKLTKDEYAEIQGYILRMEVMPSMRLLWSAGKACRKTNVCAYNCSFVAPTKLRDFAEIMYLSMCGTGVGFSVEKKFVDQLPIIEKQKGKSVSVCIIEDSKEGWGNAMTYGLEKWYAGNDVVFDYSKLRPKGAKLITMGGRSSGPEPLKNLLDFTRAKIFERQEQRLKPIDVHDIICKVGEIVVNGGMRRSALISLSDLDDKEMRKAKFGKFWKDNPQRFMANNSATYEVKPNSKKFLKEWTSLALSGSGERGIFNRENAINNMPERRRVINENYFSSLATNPCGEINLRNKSFCNLSEVICRKEDTKETLKEKIRIATILGTYQSSLTNFPYISKDWENNVQEERLLGVSLTGQWDCPIIRNEKFLVELKDYAIEINKKYAEKMGINSSVAITCVKPSGTVSQLVDASSGMHPRHAKYYVRRVRISATDPLFKLFKNSGYPYHPEVGQEKDTATTYVLEFPIKSPTGAITKNNLSAIKLLEHWQKLKINYTEHNPSATISVGDNEWVRTGNWVYKNWDIVGGLSFLPRSKHIYKLAPYRSITKEKYDKMVSEFPKIDFSRLPEFEKEDTTQGSKELACSAGVCSIDDYISKPSSSISSA